MALSGAQKKKSNLNRVEARIRKAIDLINSDAVAHTDDGYFIKGYHVMVMPSTNPALTQYKCECVWGSHEESHLLTNACSHALALAGYLDVPLALPTT